MALACAAYADTQRCRRARCLRACSPQWGAGGCSEPKCEARRYRYGCPRQACTGAQGLGLCFAEGAGRGRARPLWGASARSTGRQSAPGRTVISRRYGEVRPSDQAGPAQDRPVHGRRWASGAQNLSRSCNRQMTFASLAHRWVMR